MQKVEALRGTDLSFEKKVVEEKLRAIEATRNLSHWIVHVDMVRTISSLCLPVQRELCVLNPLQDGRKQSDMRQCKHQIDVCVQHSMPQWKSLIGRN